MRLAAVAGFGIALLALYGVFDTLPHRGYAVATTVVVGSVTVAFAALSALKSMEGASLWIVVACLLATVLLPIWVVLGVTGAGYASLAEMDFDGDGQTTLVEIVTAMNVARVPSRDRPGCFEYIDAKSATQVYKMTCTDFR